MENITKRNRFSCKRVKYLWAHSEYQMKPRQQSKP